MIETNFRRRLRAGIAVAGVSCLALSGTAGAADPASGTVGPDSPKVSWGGTLTSSGIWYNAWDRDPELECSPPTCDPFDLTVQGGGVDLTLGLNIQAETAAGGEGGGGIRVVLPDGSIQFAKGTSGPKTTLKLKLKAAKPGKYEVTSVASYLCCSPTKYLAYAELPTAAAPPPGGGTTAPGGTLPAPTAPAAGGDGSDDAAPSITATAPKASAKKLKKSRKLAVALSSTGPVSNLKATLKQGKKVIGKGKLGTLSGNGKITVKIAKKAARKLKAGRYSFAVAGIDSEGRTVGTRISFKVKK